MAPKNKTTGVGNDLSVLNLKEKYKLNSLEYQLGNHKATGLRKEANGVYEFIFHEIPDLEGFYRYLIVYQLKKFERDKQCLAEILLVRDKSKTTYRALYISGFIFRDGLPAVITDLPGWVDTVLYRMDILLAD